MCTPVQFIFALVVAMFVNQQTPELIHQIWAENAPLYFIINIQVKLPIQYNTWKT